MSYFSDVVRFAHGVEMQNRNPEFNQLARLLYCPFNTRLPDLLGVSTFFNFFHEFVGNINRESTWQG